MRTLLMLLMLVGITAHATTPAAPDAVAVADEVREAFHRFEANPVTSISRGC